MVTKSLKWSLCWVRLIQSTPPWPCFCLLYLDLLKLQISNALYPCNVSTLPVTWHTKFTAPHSHLIHLSSHMDHTLSSSPLSTPHHRPHHQPHVRTSRHLHLADGRRIHQDSFTYLSILRRCFVRSIYWMSRHEEGRCYYLHCRSVNPKSTKLSRNMRATWYMMWYKCRKAWW